jgi:hypothetical protein
LILEGSLNTVIEPLANNGGPTPTHLPVADGSAIDTGDNTLVPHGISTDQRGAGFFRVNNGTVDIGAVEKVIINENNDDPSAFIQRLYQNILGRRADKNGLDFWIDKIQSESAAFVAQGFFNSQEFTALGLDNAAFINILYQTVFGRDADTGGMNFWLSKLQNGKLRDMVLYGFLTSKEFAKLATRFSVTGFSDKDNALYQIKQFVVRFYEQVLQRNAEVGGYDFWAEQLLSGAQSAGDIARGFFFSAEFMNKNHDDLTFINIAYQTILNRTADQGGRDFWLSQLDSGLTPLDMINGFIGSQEFKALATSYGIRVQ